MNGRKWIGIDQSEYALEATIEKLETIKGDLFVAKPEYEFIELGKISNEETPNKSFKRTAKSAAA